VSEGDFPWWTTVEGDSLAQGDLLRDFELLVPAFASPSSGRVDAEIRVHDVIVLTQSCDIENNKVGSLLLCPWWDFWEFVKAAEAQKKNWGRKEREKLWEGNLPGYHLLNEARLGDIEFGLGIVDFREVYTHPTVLVREVAAGTGKRARLLPPYREHLAQAFARFMMRVGLPVNIERDKVIRRR